MNLVRLLALAACLAAVALPGTAVAQAPNPSLPVRPGWSLELRDFLKTDGSNKALVGRSNADVWVSVTANSGSAAITVQLESKSGKRPTIDGLRPATTDDRVVRCESQYFLVRFLGTKDNNQQALVEVWLRD